MKIDQLSAAMLDVSNCFCLVCSSQSELLSVQSQLSDVTVQPSSEQHGEEEEEEDEEDDEDEEEDEEWAWRSPGGDLTKRYNRTSLNSQVRLTPINRIDYY